MGIAADTMVEGQDFDAATGEQTAAALEDLVTRATLSKDSELLDQVTLETYLDTDFYRARVKDGSITLAKLAAAVQGAINPTGAIIPFGGSAAPSGYLECDGTAKSRTTYADLYAVIGDNFGEGNGSTTFNLPDGRGMFLRGHDNGAGNDPDAGTRTAQATGGNTGDSVGSVQAEAMLAHTHAYTAMNSNTYKFDSDVSGAHNLYYSRGGQTSGSAGGNETRPINLSTMFIIKT